MASSVGVVRAPFAPIVRRARIAAAAGAVAAALAAAICVTAQAGDRYRERYTGERWIDPAGGPLRWLRYSGQNFQRLMSMLAERSARVHGVDDEAWPRFTSERRQTREGDEDEAPYEPATRGSGAPPGRGAHEGGEPGRQARWPRGRWPLGGEAKAGRHQPVIRVEVWRPQRLPSCRHAGEVVGRWYVVRPGDTLWRIARAQYGDGRAWRRILRANWRTVWDPDLIHPCQRLYLPRWRNGARSDAPATRRLWAAALPFLRSRGAPTSSPG